VPCPDGTYMPYGWDGTDVVGTPAGRESDCLVCDAGFICKNGAIATVGCPPGQYTKAGSSECARCLPG